MSTNKNLDPAGKSLVTIAIIIVIGLVFGGGLFFVLSGNTNSAENANVSDTETTVAETNATNSVSLDLELPTDSSTPTFGSNPDGNTSASSALANSIVGRWEETTNTELGSVLTFFEFTADGRFTTDIYSELVGSLAQPGTTFGVYTVTGNTITMTNGNGQTVAFEDVRIINDALHLPGGRTLYRTIPTEPLNANQATETQTAPALASEIIGRWVTMDGTIFEFSADGKCKITSVIGTYDLRYEISGNTLTIHLSNGDRDVSENVRVEGNNLHIDGEIWSRDTSASSSEQSHSSGIDLVAYVWYASFNDVEAYIFFNADGTYSHIFQDLRGNTTGGITGRYEVSGDTIRCISDTGGSSVFYIVGNDIYPEDSSVAYRKML